MERGNIDERKERKGTGRSAGKLVDIINVGERSIVEMKISGKEDDERRQFARKSKSLREMKLWAAAV